MESGLARSRQRRGRWALTRRPTTPAKQADDLTQGAPAAGPELKLVALPQGSRVHEAAERLMQQILAGEFKSGQRLPSERTLVQQLGVSRTVLREALSSLEALGFIEARTTRGRFVTPGGSPAHSRTLVRAWLHQHAREISEFDEIRSVVEAQAIRAMSRWDAVNAANRAADILAEQRDAIEHDDVVRAAECDARFHRLLCSYTHNGALRSLCNGIIENARTASLAVYSLADSSAASLSQHGVIVEALSAGEVERAAELATAHTLDNSRRSRSYGDAGAARGS